jgi:hypothetical protein
VNLESFASMETPRVVQSVSLDVNGASIAEWHFEFGQTAVRRRAIVPAILTQEPRLELTFHIHDPVAPKSIGMGADSRELGINLRTVTILDGIAH